MIFFALVATVLGLAVWALVYSWLDDMPGLGWFLFIAICGAGLIPVSGIPAIVAESTPIHESGQIDLRALATDSSLGGSFFLGSGSVDGKRVLNYVLARDGYSEVGQVDADKSRIYEDSPERPRISVWVKTLDEWWLAPFEASGFTVRYDFHIPNDSVIESYTIDNK